MTTYRASILATGLAFPEGPRWHQGRLWFTDQHFHKVQALSPDGMLETIVETSDLPGGLGWLPDGTTLVVYMTERRILRLDPGADGPRLSEYADLSAHASFHCNDMVVDRAGRIYAGNFGYDANAGAPIAPAEIVLVDSDGSIEPFATGVIFPNGSVITPDGATLLVAETFAHRITAFGLDARGRCASRAPWAELGAANPDGICLDTDGALWVASPGTHELLRVRAGGEILDRCDTSGAPYACMLGGDDRRTLYACTAETHDAAEAKRLASGRIEQARVAVPGAGLP